MARRGWTQIDKGEALSGPVQRLETATLVLSMMPSSIAIYILQSTCGKRYGIRDGLIPRLAVFTAPTT